MSAAPAYRIDASQTQLIYPSRRVVLAAAVRHGHAHRAGSTHALPEL